MLSYRHAFHAGNHADVLKHWVLWAVLSYFNRKDKPYWYIDTHSGVGLYDLRDATAQKVGEHRDGIGRLSARSGLPENLAAFLAHIQTVVPDENLYCGSPWLAQSLLRDGDKLRLFELHPADFQLLQNNMKPFGRRALVKQTDGFQALSAVLPPPTRRAVVLIDPPYEDKNDYTRVVQVLKETQKRFAQGCYLVWYPCLSRRESVELPERLLKLSPENYLRTELFVRTSQADGFGMHGSGMFVINPPYQLSGQLAEVLPTLTEILGLDAGAHYVLDYRCA